MGAYIIVMCCFVMAWGKQNDGLKHRVEILEKAIKSLPDVDSLISRIESLESLLDVIPDVSSLEKRVERLENFHVGCEAPNAVDHAIIVSDHPEKTFYKPDEYVIYECALEYFRKSGNDYRQCVCDMTVKPAVCMWSSEPPVCALDKCYLQKDEGNSECGEQPVQRDFWDHTKHYCNSFTYRGCGGNENNFVAGTDPGPTCHGCNPCFHQKLIGSCTDTPVPSEQRWYYSTDIWNCEAFEYSGCVNDPDQGVNKNNFKSKEECCKNCWC